MSEEEIIKTINVNLDKIKSLCTDDCINKTVVIEPLEYALKCLLDLYNKEKEKNKKLKEHCRELIQEKQELTSAVENSISNNMLEEYLKQAEERYKTYKEASKENEDCRSGVWKYLGQVNLLKRILGKSINIATLDGGNNE